MNKLSILLIALMVISVGFLSGCTDSQSNGEVEDNDDVIFVAWITPAVQDLQERLDYDSEKTDDLYWDGFIVSLINAVENYESQIINFNVSSKWQLVYSLLEVLIILVLQKIEQIILLQFIGREAPTI